MTEKSMDRPSVSRRTMLVGTTGALGGLVLHSNTWRCSCPLLVRLGIAGKKRQYRVTAEGERFFLGWMNEPLVYARVRIPHTCAPPTLNQPLPPPHVSSFSGTVPTMPSS